MCFRTILTTALFLTLSVQADAQVHFDLPPQPLGKALTTVGVLSNVNIYFDAPIVDGLQAPALKAELGIDDALRRLLAGTQLRAVHVDANTIRVVSDVATKHAQSTRDTPTGSVYAAPNVHLAYASPSGGTGLTQSFASPAEDGNDTSAVGGSTGRSPNNPLAEVIVSAEKRNERLQDVPVPVTAISADVLVNSNQLLLQDYYSTVPGLSLTPSTQSSQILTIRGITTGAGNPTVGVVVDDMPYGSSTGLGGGLVVPDIDPGDLARVEVLRGPQGTLYGASSMGGLIKFVTVDPSTDRFSGRVQAGLSGVSNGAEPGYNVRGSVNVPLGETLALRASAFTRVDPGYIDNPDLSLHGVNEQRVSGGRVAALWRPVEDFSVKLSALYQVARGNGSNDVNILPGLGDLQQSYIQGVGGFDRRVQAYNATVNARFAGIDLISITGYNVNSFADSFDYTSIFAPLTEGQFGVSGTPAFERNKTEKFTQELRLSSSVGSVFDWLVGGFYTHENSPYVQNLMAEDTNTGAFVGQWVSFDQPTTFQEYAGFVNFTVHLTQQFDVQLGARESHIRQTFQETDTGPYVDLFEGVPSPNIIPQSTSDANAFTYLLTPRWKISPDLMVYARLASGYRAGGPNQTPGGIIPPQYNPDKTKNYELGLKGDVLNHLLSFDASAYYIDWKDIQLQLVNPDTGIGYFTNGSRAKSQGLELSVEARPVQGLTVAAWVSWDEAILTRDLPSSSTVYGVKGDRLPFGSRFSGNFSVDENFPLWKDLTGFVGGLVSYVGPREGNFLPPPPDANPRQLFPGYARTDLHAGIKSDAWNVNVFINNVANRRGVLQGGNGYFPAFAFQYIQPRTAGLSVIRTF